MKRPGWWNERTLRMCMILTLCVIVLDGFATTFIITKPFWIDEWRVIYNLKTKDIPALWGPLDCLQQFPRLYLSLIKCLTSLFDYSYQSLRLPSFIVGTGSIILAWRLMRRIYPAGAWLQYLFVMILVSSQPFTKYYVQVKQYSMDIALSLIAIWQVLELLRLVYAQAPKPGRYLLLCGSFLLAPFFSYTYPIAIAPAFVLMLIASKNASAVAGRKEIVRLWLPLFLCALSIAAFYAFDARQLLADRGMKSYWQYNLAGGLDTRGILNNFYTVFAQVGSGFVFQTLFGILGTAAFLRACGKAPADVRSGVLDTVKWMRLYSVLLLLIVGALFLAGKLPLGESRLNAFLTVSVSILVIDLLRALRAGFPRAKAAVLVLSIMLYAGVAGNIYTTLIAAYTDADRAKKRLIYTTIARAIHTAQTRHLPLLATPGVAYPYEQDQNLPDTTKVPGDWVLKTHPAYHVADRIPVYPIPNMEEALAGLDALPAGIDSAVVCDGATFRIVARR